MINALSTLRECLAPIAGITAATPIHIQENGFPTGPGRTYERQAEALRNMVRTVHEQRGTYNVTNYRWFNMRDADTESPNFQQQYGLMTDAYVPKPAFEEYERLVDELAGSGGSAGGAGASEIRLHLTYWRGKRGCIRGRNVRAVVRGPGRGAVRSAVFRLNGRRVKRDRRPPFALRFNARRLPRVAGVSAQLDLGDRRTGRKQRFRRC